MGVRFWEAPALPVDDQGRPGKVVPRALHGEVIMRPTGRQAAYTWVELPRHPTPMDLDAAQRRVKADLVEQFTRRGLGGQD